MKSSKLYEIKHKIENLGHVQLKLKITDTMVSYRIKQSNNNNVLNNIITITTHHESYIDIREKIENKNIEKNMKWALKIFVHDMHKI